MAMTRYGSGQAHHGKAQRGLPDIHAPRARRAPEPSLVPEPLRAVDRREERADRADAAAGDNVDLDARFMQRPQHAGVVGPGRPRSGQDERSAAAWRVRIWRRGEAAVRHSLGS